MLLVKQRRDNRVQSDRLTLTRCTRHQEVRRLCQVKHKDIVANGLTNSTGQFHLAFLIYFAVDDAFHRNDALFLVWHLDTNRSFTGNWSDDTNTLSCQRKGNIIFEVANLTNARSFGRHYFIERDGWTYCRLNAGNLHAKLP